MSIAARFLLSLLVVLFTYNQVVLAHAISKHSKVALCDPMEVDAESKNIEEALGLTDAASRTLFFAIIPFFVISTAEETIAVEVPHCSTPHGLHVPIYLDNRVLIV